MTALTFDRVAASGGAAFMLLALSTVVVAPPTPKLDAPAAEIRDYLVDAHGRFGASVALMALAVLALCLALGYVGQRLRGIKGGATLTAIFLVAGAAVVSTALSGVLLQGVLAQHAAPALDDSTLLALYRTWQVVAFMGPPLPLAIVLAVVATATLRDAVFPRWMGWVALVASIGGLSTSLLNLGTDITAPLLLDLGSFLLTCFWLTAMTVTAFKTRQPSTEPANALATK